MASPAAAQSFQTGNGFDVNIGGFYRGFVGAADVGGNIDGDFDGVSVFNDGELFIRPSMTLDNGLTVGVDIDMELQNSRFIDETYLYITGDQLGYIRIGQDNSAGYQSMVGAPTVTQGIAINSGTTSAFVPFAGNLGFFRQASGSSYTEVSGSNDTQRLTYFTPSFNGLVVGVSYTPEARGDRARTFAFDRDTEGLTKDAFDIGAKYSQSFGTTDITLGARWGTGDRNAIDVDPDIEDDAPGLFQALTNAGITEIDGGDPTTWGIGAQVGFGAFAVGGSYTENSTDLPGGFGDQQGWSLGVTYDLVGPWALEAGTYQGTVENGSFASDSDLEHYKIGAAMSLAPGVQWNVFYLHSRSEDKLEGERVKGDVIGTGIALSF